MYTSQVLTTISQYGPISAPQLLQILKASHPQLNKTTVYRQLEKLVFQKQIQEFSAGNNFKYYELSNNHHHIFCQKCHRLECLAENCAISNPKTNYQINGHNLEFFGLCPQCQS